MAETNIKPTLSKPVSPLSKGYQRTFDTSMESKGITNLNEIDGMLGEAEQSLKKKIFSLAKMEALVFSDPKLAAIYEEMSENGEEKYGYHYNETIMNMLFNDYVLNSPKYLQKYKQAVPKEKKRRDKSGINQLKHAGEDMQTRNLEPKKPKPIQEIDVDETTGTGGAGGGGAFSGSGQYSAPLGYAKKVDEEEFVEPEEQQPTQPEEDDCVISSNGNIYSVSCGGKYINKFVEWDDAMKAVVDWQEANNFYPNIWFISDHGNADIIDRDGKILSETTGSASSGAYVGPAMWGSGDLMKTKGKAKVKTTPMVKGGTIIQETKNYLIDSEGFEKFIESLNEDLNRQDSDVNDAIVTDPKVKIPTGVWDKTGPGKGIASKSPVGTDTKRADDFIIDKTSAFTSNTVKDWDTADTDTELDTVETGDPDKANLQAMEESKNLDEKAVSKKQQKFMGMVHAVQKGELSPDKVGGDVADTAKSMKPKDAEDFASTKHKGLPEKVKPKLKEDTQTMIADKPDSMSNKAVPTGTQSGNMDTGLRTSGGGSMSESFSLLEELNNELKAFSIHQDKLKKMTEDRRPSALILKDRLGNDNEKNFKKDLQHSGTKEIIDVEKELQWKDQQTEVGENPYELGEKLEKGEIKATDAKSGEALKNVGDSANDEGDEIPKRNLSKEEQDEVNLYRLGLGDFVYDNEVGKRFEDRMKADMGDKLYKQRQDKLAFRAKAPMYNKDPQPVEDTTSDKVQFNKEQSGWNEREGLKEGMITGKYRDNLNKRRIIDFNLNEVWELKTDKPTEFLKELNFDGLGNTYTQKVSVNENVVKAVSGKKFYTNGVEVFVLKTPAQSINESKEASKPVVNEQMEKMKHLVGYNTATFVKQSKIL